MTLYRIAWVAFGGSLAFLALAVAIALPQRSPDASGPGGGERVIAPGMAKDGPVPTATPLPSPTPLPGAISACMEAPGPDSRALPADEDSILRNCQVVAYYGHPFVPALGILGAEDRAGMLAQLDGEVAAYDAANGSRSAIAAYHVIWGVAQPHAEGDALSRLPDEDVQEWIALAEEHDAIVILDVQFGHSTIAAEVERILPYLENPRVHLALDPEWTMPHGYVPGELIGWMTAAQINEAQAMVQELIEELGLQNKLVIVHQFTEGMIRDKETLEEYPDVDLVIDMDGFGSPELKIGQYNRYVRDDAAQHAGMKLFYTLDVPLMSPAEVIALEPEPDVIIYQ